MTDKARQELANRLRNVARSILANGIEWSFDSSLNCITVFIFGRKYEIREV